MTRKSDPTRYGTVAVAIHWLSALVIVALLVTGFRIGQSTDTIAETEMLRFHAPMGFAILLLTLVRIVWWWKFDAKPAAVGSDHGAWFGGDRRLHPDWNRW